MGSAVQLAFLEAYFLLTSLSPFSLREELVKVRQEPLLWALSSQPVIFLVVVVARV